MRGHTICDVWARIPGLNDYWCFQIQWRIGIDEEIIAALTEPCYPAPITSNDDDDDDNTSSPSLETVILVQTIYLCQLFLHLQEFDPGVGPEQRDGEEELVRVFQDSLAREFNNVPSPRRDDGGPAPDGETLERVVRGLMKAQRDEGDGSTMPGTTTSLQQLLVKILAELNRPLFDKARRYEQAFGPRTDETWAARFATRVMQWRWSIRPPSGQLTEDLIRVFPHDVHPLDEEGLQVYRIVRNAAPGHIHLVTPVQPDLQRHASSTNHRHGHQRSVSSGLKIQHILQESSVHTRSNSTPRTPQFQQTIQTESSSTTTTKRGSPHDLQLPPSKRPRSMAAGEGASSARREAGGATTGEVPIRSAPAGIDAEATNNNNLLWRVLDGISNLGRQIDGMHEDLGQRFSQLDDRLKHIEEWISDEV